MTADTAEGTKGNGMRDRAQTVIVGAGIVGASAAYHLAELGSTDVLVIDQGPLFETGGSTSHAPGLVFQTNGSRTMCRIAQDTVRLYGSLELDGEPCWYGVGGIEVATTPERMAGAAPAPGVRPVVRHRRTRSCSTSGRGHRADPAARAERDPRGVLRPERRHREGGADRHGARGEGGGQRRDLRGPRAGRRLRHPGRPRARRAKPTGVDIECERVLICAGIWGPTVGALAGVPIPLVAVQHQLVWTDPIPELSGETCEVVHPILRHQDHAMYFRHREDHYGVGNYRHEPIVTLAARRSAGPATDRCRR